MRKVLCAILFTAFVFCIQAQDMPISRVDTLSTLNSFQKLGEFCTIEFQGDYEDILQYINNLYTGGFVRPDSNFNCSLYSGIGDPQNLFYGRNMDNPEQDVLVGKYSPPGQYSSIALNRLSDVGLPTGTDYTSLSTHEKKFLLKSPYYTADGLNETGLAAGLAYVRPVTIHEYPEKEYIFITLLCRRILDGASNCAEALEIANSYNVFDAGANNVVSHHLLVTDATGETVVLEYVDDRFVAIPTDVNWQVLTNSVIYGASLEQLFYECYRYEMLYNVLEDQNGIIEDWRNAMDIIAMPTWHQGTQGTQWSTIADLNDKLMYISIDRDFDNIAMADVETFTFLNYGNLYNEDPILVDGDTDGIMESGETIMIYLTVSADFPTPGLQASLSTQDADIEFLSATYAYGDIAPSMPATNVDSPFLIRISETAQEHTATIDVSFSTSYDRTFSTSFEFPVQEQNAVDDVSPATVFKLSNTPNPFNPQTVIHYSIPEQNHTQLAVFNAKGQRVRTLVNEVKSQGEYHIAWDGTDDRGNTLSSGIYFCRLESGNLTQTRKLMMLK